ncbi:MAG: multiple sugar transport system substrate-binding protein [Actinomycetota bacterium]|jgi:multiple sugar transport system substrate-binding protein|nr:multiple sugar transport system substrate-binding protein [Actinomycetota bacterium]
MRRRIAAGIALFAMITVACTAGGGSSDVSAIDTSSGATHAPVTLNLWSFYNGREFQDYAAVLADFHKLYPWITVKHTPGKSDADIVRAINSGSPPDMTISQGPDNVAKFCSTGAMQDLAPFLQGDGTDISKVIPAQALRYTSYNGDQCTLPVLSDAYGLYYNNPMFQKAHITSPPKTLTELEADAKKLTQFNPDGSIKVAGFMPLHAFYENPNFYLGNFSGSKWYDSNGKSAFASDPTWAAMLEWQKAMIADVYGPDGDHLLQEFFAQLGGANSEWGPAQGFDIGKVAMTCDGEWRTAFIKQYAPKLDYSTAPMPVLDSIASTYGRGQIGGDIVGIPRGAANSAAAWLLVKYLATDTGAELKLAYTLGNVPTTFEAIKTTKQASDPHFKPFLDIFSNPISDFKQLTPIGDADQSMWSNFVDNYEAGKVSDLQAGLLDLASQIDKQSALG